MTHSEDSPTPTFEVKPKTKNRRKTHFKELIMLKERNNNSNVKAANNSVYSSSIAIREGSP